MDLSSKNQEYDHLMNHFDKYLREFQATLNDYRSELSKVKMDEKGFNEKTERINGYFEGVKRENQQFKDSMAESEKML
jgi:hypothetical protein